MRVIIVEDKNGSLLQFITNTVREAELIFCGLKLLLERETHRVGLRGGVPLGSLSELEKDVYNNSSVFNNNNQKVSNLSLSSSATSDSSDDETQGTDIPEGRQSWSQVPSRGHLKANAHHFNDKPILPPQGQDEAEEDPKYRYGQLLLSDLVTDVLLDIPLALCRALILDSTSPLIKKWEINRGDSNYSKTGKYSCCRT